MRLGTKPKIYGQRKEGFYYFFHFLLIILPTPDYFPSLTSGYTLGCTFKEVDVSKNSKSYYCTAHPNHIQIPLKIICENAFSQQLHDQPLERILRKKNTNRQKSHKGNTYKDVLSRIRKGKQNKKKMRKQIKQVINQFFVINRNL